MDNFIHIIKEGAAAKIDIQNRRPRTALGIVAVELKYWLHACRWIDGAAEWRREQRRREAQQRARDVLRNKKPITNKKALIYMAAKLQRKSKELQRRLCCCCAWLLWLWCAMPSVNWEVGKFTTA
jgi:hypothetical protein